MLCGGAFCNDGVENKNRSSGIAKQKNAEAKALLAHLDREGGKLLFKNHADAGKTGSGIMDVQCLNSRSTGGPAKIKQLPRTPSGIRKPLGESLWKKENTAGSLRDGNRLRSWSAGFECPMAFGVCPYLMGAIPEFGAGEGCHCEKNCGQTDRDEGLGNG